jgi:hypothetical protein
MSFIVSPNPKGLLLMLLLHSSAADADPMAVGLVRLVVVCAAVAGVDRRLARDDLAGALLEDAAPDNSAFRSEKLSEVLINERLDKLSKLIEPLIICKKRNQYNITFFLDINISFPPHDEYFCTKTKTNSTYLQQSTPTLAKNNNLSHRT